MIGVSKSDVRECRGGAPSDSARTLDPELILEPAAGQKRVAQRLRGSMLYQAQACPHLGEDRMAHSRPDLLIFDDRERLVCLLDIAAKQLTARKRGVRRTDRRVEIVGRVERRRRLGQGLGCVSSLVQRPCAKVADNTIRNVAPCHRPAARVRSQISRSRSTSSTTINAPVREDRFGSAGGSDSRKLPSSQARSINARISPRRPPRRLSWTTECAIAAR